MKRNFLLSVAFLLTLSLSVAAQTASEIVNKYHEAIGGKNKLRAIKSIHAEVAISLMGMQTSATIKKDKDRGFFVQQRLPMGEILIIRNKKELWTKTPNDTEPQKRDLESIGTKKRSFVEFTNRITNTFMQFSDLVDYAEEKISMSLEKKKEKIKKSNNKKIKCYVITAEVPKKEEQKGEIKIKLYFSLNDYLFQRRESTITTEEGEKKVVREDLSDYREVNDILVPHRVTITQPGQLPTTITVSAIRINPEFPDNLFTVEEGEYVDE